MVSLHDKHDLKRWKSKALKKGRIAETIKIKGKLRRVLLDFEEEMEDKGPSFFGLASAWFGLATGNPLKIFFGFAEQYREGSRYDNDINKTFLYLLNDKSALKAFRGFNDWYNFDYDDGIREMIFEYDANIVGQYGSVIHLDGSTGIAGHPPKCGYQ